eukprot:CAMPEP_0183375616 /NCGR_PEP_ID=MMETSP0164_2-20130417/117871_1 /TAXON_ID=221442 /ORGANISM="Coccolithus pelagicus ssp braarudi, Strain PLY182g" /LENGTH=79 /DNA_ID=CAMNT_0025552801 /DNA_START=69 /DNA_END=308 /DNA_ORIENTATION=-
MASTAGDEIRSIALAIPTERDRLKILRCSRSCPLFVPQPIELDWFRDERTAPHVLVLGQAFLRTGALVVDVEARRAMFG